MYNSKEHPSVKDNRKTYDKVSDEFSDTFDILHSKLYPDTIEITEGEFLEYY